MGGYKIRLYPVITSTRSSGAPMAARADWMIRK